MIYRRLSSDGDYILGQGSSTFISGNEAIAQALVTWIKLLYGEWWENVNEGTPLWQSMIGKPGSESNLKSIDNILKNRILTLNLNGENLVTSIKDYNRTYDPITRKYTFRVEVITIYDDVVNISDEFNLLG